MKRIIFLILLIFICFILLQSNPSRSAYIDWMNHQAMNQSSNIFEKGVISVAGKSVLDLKTTQTDYYMFSIYSTDLSAIGMGQVKTIAIGNKFITFSKGK